jgi:toxin ParE1/3/4
MKIIITQSALLRLRKIHAYYKSRVSRETADRIRHKIFDAIEILKENPEVGPIEENLQDLHLGHRRLVEGHYKIIYRLEGHTVYVTDIFDSRQDPSKMIG